MSQFDLPVGELRAYRPDVAEPADFDEFWQRTLTESRSQASPPHLRRINSPMQSVSVFDVVFSGYAGDPVSAWLLMPAEHPEPLSAVVEYVGYGGGRGLPHEHLHWAVCGYAHLIMDTRGQGSSWGSGGMTADPHGSGPSARGFLTRGIDHPHSYYYRRVYTDAVLAIDALRSLPSIDAERVAVHGGSQGGGISIAAAGLSQGLVAAMPDVPFLSHFERAVILTDREPYQEIVRYLAVHRDAVARVFETLSYFDAVNFARRATAPAMFSVGLMDATCPPSTVYAAHNNWRGHSEMVEYPFNDHEGGLGAQWERQVDFFARQLAMVPAPTRTA